MTVGPECCEDRSISFDFGLPGAGVADETDDTDSSVTAEAARDSRLSGLLSSRSAVVVKAGGAAAMVEAAAVDGAAAVVVDTRVSVTGSVL